MKVYLNFAVSFSESHEKGNNKGGQLAELSYIISSTAKLAVFLCFYKLTLEKF